MSYVRIWRYQVTPGQENDFLKAYGPEGDWAGLFRRSESYRGTELLRAVPPATGYLTLDRWRSETDWQRFLEEHHTAYQELDRHLAPLCQEDIDLGSFEA